VPKEKRAAKAKQKVESRDDRYARQTTEQFAELGRFVQSFEQMVNAIRLNCLYLLPMGSVADQSLLNILLHHRAMTVAPLFDCMRALYAQRIKMEGESWPAEEIEVIRSILKQLSTGVEEVANRRNQLLHATWYIGWAKPSDSDFSELRVHKGKTSKEGLKFEPPVGDLNELKEQRAKCDELFKILMKLQGTFTMRRIPGEGPSIRLCFKKVDGRWV